MRRLRLVTFAALAAFTSIAYTIRSSPFDARLECGIAPAPTAQSNGTRKSLTTIPKPAVHFRDIAIRAGLQTIPHSRSDRRYVLDTMAGGGIALFDCDNDGKLDMVVVNDSTIDQYLNGGDLMVTLYHQDTDSPTLHFTDVTKSAGLTNKGWGMGIAVGDFDNDGLLDLYVTGYGHNVLYHNLGGCKFEDVTKKAGLRLVAFVQAPPGLTMIGMDSLIYSSLVTFTRMFGIFHTSRNPSATKAFSLRCRIPWKGRATSCFAIVATELLKMYPRRLVSMTLISSMAWVLFGETTTTMAGPTSS